MAQASSCSPAAAAPHTEDEQHFYVCRGNPFTSRNLPDGQFRIKKNVSVKITPVGRHQLLSMGSTVMEISYRTVQFAVAEVYRVELEKCKTKLTETLNKRERQKANRRRLENSVRCLGLKNPSSTLAWLDRTTFYPALLKKPGLEGAQAFPSARAAVSAVDPAFQAKKSRTIASHMTCHAMLVMEFMQSTARINVENRCAAGVSSAKQAHEILCEEAKRVAEAAHSSGLLWTGKY